MNPFTQFRRVVSRDSDHHRQSPSIDLQDEVHHTTLLSGTQRRRLSCGAQHHEEGCAAFDLVLHHALQRRKVHVSLFVERRHHRDTQTVK